MQLTKDEKVTLEVHEDADGFDTPESIAWTVNDGSIVSLTVAEDRRSCEVVANAPGTAVVTVTDHAASPRLVASEAFDVLYADEAKVELIVGEPAHR